MNVSSPSPPPSIEANETEHVDFWKNFGSWIHCIAVVTFDLELGQALEHCFPSHIELSDVEKSNISYLSFPDSNTGCVGDTQYYFRIKKSHSSELQSKYAKYLQCKECPPVLLKDASYYYGFVYFRQVSDKTIKRGYFQKSVILLSSLPYFTFFKSLIEVIAHAYFESGISAIESACYDINKWPSLQFGQILHLPIVDKNFKIFAPPLRSEIKFVEDNHPPMESFSKSTFSFLSEIDIFQYLHDVIHHIQLLWELVLLGEPIAVFGPRPNVCSSTVLALTSLIRPLRYNYDYRPYFTIHDNDFKEVIAKDKKLSRVIIGVTNPFFLKALQHWPNILKIGQFETNGRRLSLNTSNNSIKHPGLSDDLRPGLYSKYKPFLKKDNKIFKTLVKDIMTSNENQQDVLKRYFLELTQSFIIPLERYMTSLMPLQKSISPFKAPPTLRAFNIDEFIESVKVNGPRLTCGVKGDWTGLYRRFLFTDNFEDWFRRRRREMRVKVVSLHLLALSDSDLSSWCIDKSEVEIVDMVLRIRKKIAFAKQRKLELPPDTVQRLQAQVGVTTERLPADLQRILIKNEVLTETS